MSQDGGGSALIKASAGGHEACVSLLLGAGADVKAVDKVSISSVYVYEMTKTTECDIIQWGYREIVE